VEVKEGEERERGGVACTARTKEKNSSSVQLGTLHHQIQGNQSDPPSTHARSERTHHLRLLDQRPRSIQAIHLDLQQLTTIGLGKLGITQDLLELGASVGEPGLVRNVVGVEETEQLLPLPVTDVVVDAIGTCVAARGE
jgi:hypothetical protein